MYLESANGERARVNVSARLAGQWGGVMANQTHKCSISLNRELELLAGDYVEEQLQPDSRLWTLCQAAALNRSHLQPGVHIFVATHT